MDRHVTEIVCRDKLTPREAQVLALLCSALTDKAIARQLGLAIGTVTTHIETVYQKLGVQNEQLNKRMAALRVALARGMVRLSCVLLAVVMSGGGNDALAARVARPSGCRPSVSRRADCG